MKPGVKVIPKAEHRGELGREVGVIATMHNDDRHFFFEGDPADAVNETSKYEPACPHDKAMDECPVCILARHPIMRTGEYLAHPPTVH
jgi:hypothetical protein